ncbi:MAG: SGNH/GDSL hydrolase family protein [Oligoflexales bacterium]|nr:SGNH/GDSL hydrolase family protein [Oligoflexales bacterium]
MAKKILLETALSIALAFLFSCSFSCKTVNSSSNSDVQSMDGTSGPPIKIVMLGDSITWGVTSGLLKEEESAMSTFGYAARFVEMAKDNSLNYTFENAGCPGGTTYDFIQAPNVACGKLNKDTVFNLVAKDKLPADYLTILLGTNDAAGYMEDHPSSGSEYKENLVKIISLAKGFGVKKKVILMTPPPSPCSTFDRQKVERLKIYTEKVAEICKEDPKVVCGPDMQSILNYNDFDNCDVHPTKGGHLKMAQALYKFLYTIEQKP